MSGVHGQRTYCEQVTGRLYFCPKSGSEAVSRLIVRVCSDREDAACDTFFSPACTLRRSGRSCYFLCFLIDFLAFPFSFRFLMRRYSPPYYSPPRRGYGGRGRSPPRRGYGGGGKEQGSGSLLVRNIPLSCRPEDLRVPFERFGPVRDVYMPKDYYSGEPRGFAFIEFVDPCDASEAQYHMNRQVFGGREITVVVAAESRKRPEDMRKRAKPRGPSGYDRRRPSHYGGRSRSRSRSRSPRYSSRARHHSRSYSPAPKSRHDNHYSPKRRQRSYTRSPRDHSREHIQDEDHRINSPSYIDADRNGDANGYEKKPHDAEGSRSHRRSSPRHPSVSPPGSRSRSADSSPRRNSK